jgi:hypothetical protein
MVLQADDGHHDGCNSQSLRTAKPQLSHQQQQQQQQQQEGLTGKICSQLLNQQQQQQLQSSWASHSQTPEGSCC